MDNIIIRDARDGEAGLIVQMIRNMVTDMAGYGGNTPATDNAAWEKVTATVADDLRGTSVRYLIAETAGGDAVGIAGAELITLGGAFAPKKTLHISAVYVLPQFRRGGIGSALLETAGLGAHGRQRTVRPQCADQQSRKVAVRETRFLRTRSQDDPFVRDGSALRLTTQFRIRSGGRRRESAT